MSPQAQGPKYATVYERLQLARLRGLSHVVLQIDSATVAGLLQGREAGSMMGRSFLQGLSSSCRSSWQFAFVIYIYRKANGCADVLAGLGCEHEFGLKVYEQAPMCLQQALLHDCTGVSIATR